MPKGGWRAWPPGGATWVGASAQQRREPRPRREHSVEHPRGADQRGRRVV